MDKYLVKYENNEDNDEDNDEIYGSIIFYNENHIKMAQFDINIDDITSIDKNDNEIFNKLNYNNKKNIFKNFVNNLDLNVDENKLNFIFTNGEINIKVEKNTMIFTLTAMCLGCSFSVIINNDLKNVFKKILKC
jgi:hypothetical protein